MSEPVDLTTEPKAPLSEENRLRLHTARVIEVFSDLSARFDETSPGGKTEAAFRELASDVSGMGPGRIYYEAARTALRIFCNARWDNKDVTLDEIILGIMGELARDKKRPGPTAPENFDMRPHKKARTTTTTTAPASNEISDSDDSDDSDDYETEDEAPTEESLVVAQAYEDAERARQTLMALSQRSANDAAHTYAVAKARAAFMEALNKHRRLAEAFKKHQRLASRAMRPGRGSG